MASLAELRKKNSLESLKSAAEKLTTNESSNNDNRFWQPEVDQAGNGVSVIRFLPAPPGEDVPWVRLWEHSFQGPSGKWYIERCLSTLQQPDPVVEYTNVLWASGVDSDKELARKYKRKLYYISNIMVVSDPKNPQNEGKVFLFKYGTKIFDKLIASMNPEFDDETPLNPFDPDAGANFKLKIRKVDGFRNYDKSEFASPSALADSDDKIEAIWNSTHSLQEIIDPKNFKPYADLKKRLDLALNTNDGKAADSEMDQFETMTNKIKSEASEKAASKPAPTQESFDSDEDYFASLAGE
jgi:hypothetical protein